MALRRVAPACLVSKPLAEGDRLHGDAAGEPFRPEALVSSGAARLHRAGDGGGGDHRRRRPFLDSWGYRLPGASRRARLPPRDPRLGIGQGQGRAAPSGGENVGGPGADTRSKHHHAATGEEPLPVAVTQPVTEAQGSRHGVSIGEGAGEAENSRAVSQRRRARARHLGCRGGESEVLQPLGARAYGESGGSAGGDTALSTHLQPQAQADAYAGAPGPDPAADAGRAGGGAEGRGRAGAGARRFDSVDARCGFAVGQSASAGGDVARWASPPTSTA